MDWNLRLREDSPTEKTFSYSGAFLTANLGEELDMLVKGAGGKGVRWERTILSLIIHLTSSNNRRSLAATSEAHS